MSQRSTDRKPILIHLDKKTERALTRIAEVNSRSRKRQIERILTDAAQDNVKQNAVGAGR